MHDIGKINVPRPILNKPGKLTDCEFALVKRHPGDGAAMVLSLGDADLTTIVRHHHERMDGTGYPDGLAGDDIPIGARVIAVADTFDAITSTRAYRKPRTHKQAIEILQREAGDQLDAVAVAAFVSYYAARRSVGFASVLAAAPQRLLSGLGGVQSGVAAGVAPIAQTACGVGGVALIGACLGGAGAAGVHDGQRPPRRRAPAAGRADPASRATNPAPARREPARRRTPARAWHRSDDAARGDVGAESGLGPAVATRRRTPSLPTAASRTRAVAAAEAAEEAAAAAAGRSRRFRHCRRRPSCRPSPALPDVQTVLEPVTDVVQGPQLQVPQVSVPQVNLPQVGLP